MASRRGRKAREKALRDSASGRLVRSLQLGALWNAASLPNTILAQIFFLPFAASEGRSAYHVVLLALLPTSLLTTKLLIAQAFKVLGASLGVDQTVWTLLVRLGRQSRHAVGRLAADAPPGSQSADAPSMEEDPQAALETARLSCAIWPAMTRLLLYAIRDDAIPHRSRRSRCPTTTQHSPASPQGHGPHTAPDMIVFQYIERCKSNGICTVSTVIRMDRRETANETDEDYITRRNLCVRITFESFRFISSPCIIPRGVAVARAALPN